VAALPDHRMWVDRGDWRPQRRQHLILGAVTILLTLSIIGFGAALGLWLLWLAVLARDLMRRDRKRTRGTPVMHLWTRPWVAETFRPLRGDVASVRSGPRRPRPVVL